MHRLAQRAAANAVNDPYTRLACLDGAVEKTFQLSHGIAGAQSDDADFLIRIPVGAWEVDVYRRG